MTSEASQPSANVRPNNLIGLAILALFLLAGAALASGAGPAGLLTFAFVMLGWVLAVMAHEFGHAAVAYLGGDTSVREKGYLAFDPRRYADLGTTLVIPLLALALGGIGFPGGAVYLEMHRIRSRAWRAAASLAGPAGTLAALLVLAYAVSLYGQVGGLRPLYPALAMLAFLQATALLLNLLPIPGLDGFNALKPFLPTRWTNALVRYEGLAMLGLLAALFLVPGFAGALFGAAAAIAEALGVPRGAVGRGLDAFRFWA